MTQIISRGGISLCFIYLKFISKVCVYKYTVHTCHKSKCKHLFSESFRNLSLYTHHHKHPHLSVIQIVKELLSLPSKSLCLNWLREQDLNLWPSGYEPDELPDCSIPRPHRRFVIHVASRGETIAKIFSVCQTVFAFLFNIFAPISPENKSALKCAFIFNSLSCF